MVTVCLWRLYLLLHVYSQLHILGYAPAAATAQHVLDIDQWSVKSSVSLSLFLADFIGFVNQDNNPLVSFFIALHRESAGLYCVYFAEHCRALFLLWLWRSFVWERAMKFEPWFVNPHIEQIYIFYVCPCIVTGEILFCIVLHNVSTPESLLNVRYYHRMWPDFKWSWCPSYLKL